MGSTPKKSDHNGSYNQKHFQNTVISLGGEKITIPPVVKLLCAWILFFLILSVFISGVKKQDDGKHPNSTEDTKQTAQTSTDEYGQPVANDESTTQQVMTPMEVSSDPDLNQFIADYLTALTTCNGDALKAMVTDPSVYDDMSSLIARAQYIKGYINLKCYTKAGPVENSQIVFVVTNTTLANIATAPMDFMTLYIENTDTGYIINNYTQSDDVRNYIEALKQDGDIQAVMRDIETYNSMAIENDADLKAFYQMLGQ